MDELCGEQSNLARAFGHLGSMFGSPRVPRNLAQVTAQSEQVAPPAAATALPPPPQPARAPAAHGASATAATNAATTDDATAAANAATTVAAATGGSGTVADPAGSPAGAADTAAAAASRNLPAQAVGALGALPRHGSQGLPQGPAKTIKGVNAQEVYLDCLDHDGVTPPYILPAARYATNSINLSWYNSMATEEELVKLKDKTIPRMQRYQICSSIEEVMYKKLQDEFKFEGADAKSQRFASKKYKQKAFAFTKIENTLSDLKGHAQKKGYQVDLKKFPEFRAKFNSEAAKKRSNLIAFQREASNHTQGRKQLKTHAQANPSSSSSSSSNNNGSGSGGGGSAMATDVAFAGESHGT